MKINAYKEFRIGSHVFFGRYEDFKSKDIDLLNLVDKPLFQNNIMNMKIGEKDIFFMFFKDKYGAINDAIKNNIPMACGKFLVPEFAQYIGLTIEDLKLLDPLFQALDEKHEYEKIIYESYISNGSFSLTDEQRLQAYDQYKKSRQS